jgi:rubrerythrin
MDILDFAMQMERDGETFYRDLAGRTSQTGLVRLLTSLADAEVLHYNVLKDMQEEGVSTLGDTTLLDDARNIFRDMMDEGESWPLDASQVDLYSHALELEKKSHDFYMEKAHAIDSEAGKRIFLQIAEEEKMHCEIIDSIIEFVSRPVDGNWLENAEWFHTDDY